MGRYLIRWEFTSSDVSNMKKVIRGLGSKSLDVIEFRDRQGKIIDTYNGWIMFPNGIADDETIKFIDKILKRKLGISYMVLIRR